MIRFCELNFSVSAGDTGLTGFPIRLTMYPLDYINSWKLFRVVGSLHLQLRLSDACTVRVVARCRVSAFK